MAFFRDPESNCSNYDALRMVTDWLNGGSGPPASIVGVNDDNEYAVTLENQGAGGHLNIPNELQVESDGSGVVARLFTATSLVAGTLSVTGNTTLGDAAGDTLTVNATSTFASPATFNGTLSTTAATNLGNGDADALTVIATSTFRNAANTATQLYVDPPNDLILLGSGTALTGTTSSKIEMTGKVYLTPAAASEDALNIWRSPTAGAGWTIGVTTAPNGLLKFKDDGGQGIITFGDTSSTYQFEVTGDGHVTDDLAVDGDIDVGANLTGTAGTFDWQNSGNSRLKLNSTGVGFFGATPVARPTVTGTLTGATLGQLTTVVTNLINALDQGSLGLITDSTT